MVTVSSIVYPGSRGVVVEEHCLQYCIAIFAADSSCTTHLIPNSLANISPPLWSNPLSNCKETGSLRDHMTANPYKL